MSHNKHVRQCYVYACWSCVNVCLHEFCEAENITEHNSHKKVNEHSARSWCRGQVLVALLSWPPLSYVKIHLIG